MNKLKLSYSILIILGILVNTCWLLSDYKINSFIIKSVYALEKNDTQGYLEYKDKHARIEFQYPENWYINQLRFNMIVITPFFDYYLPSFTDYYFDYIDFNKLKSELQKRSETLENLTLGIESLLGFNKTTTYNRLLSDGNSISGEYEQIQPLTINNHTAYKIIRPQAIQIALEVEDIPSNQTFHIIIFLQETKNIHPLIKSGIEKIISSINISKPFVIENIFSIGKKLVAPTEVQNLTIYTMDKYYNKVLPYTNASIKITYPSGFELDIPNTISTDKNGRFYYKWTIPEKVMFGKYIISVTTDQEDYTSSTDSLFFHVINKEKIPLRLEVENINIPPVDVYTKQFNIDFKLINPNIDKVIVNQINYSVYYNNSKLVSGEYDKNSEEFNDGLTTIDEAMTSLFGVEEEREEEQSKEVIKDSQTLQRDELGEDTWDILNRIYLEDKSIDLKINGTFSYNPYPDLVNIENKEEFNFHYAVNKFE